MDGGHLYLLEPSKLDDYDCGVLVVVPVRQKSASFLVDVEKGKPMLVHVENLLLAIEVLLLFLVLEAIL